MNSYQVKELETNSNLIGIRFKAENFGFLSRVPLIETKNLSINLSEIFSKPDLANLSQINKFETSIDKVKFLEAIVLTKLTKNYEKQDLLVLSVAKYIRLIKGNINVQDLARLYNLSLRQLERRFKKNIGLTIKEFSSIIRFNITKRKIKNLTKQSLLEIAVEVGFFDHAHMTHEFKRLSGENPSYFR